MTDRHTCVYFPNHGRVEVATPEPFEFDPREEGPGPSLCGSLVMHKARSAPPEVWMGDAGLRKFTGLTELLFNERIPLDVTLGRDVLRGLTALEWIDLSAFQMRTLEAGMLDGLTLLKFFKMTSYFSQSLLLSAAKATCTRCKKSRQPVVPKGTLTSLPPGLFRDNTALTTVNFMGNQLSTLPRDLFAGLARLTKVDFSKNAALGGLPDGFFRDTPNVRKLYFYDTSISRLDARTFGPLRRANKLRLEDCQLTSIAPDTFRGWSSLLELNLRGNALQRLEAGTFRDTTSLRRLDLSANRLTAVDEPPWCSQWTTLQLSQEADGDDKGEREAPCLPLGGFGDADQIAVMWAEKCFSGNKGMKRCLEREWAGGRWETFMKRATDLVDPRSCEEEEENTGDGGAAGREEEKKKKKKKKKQKKKKTVGALGVASGVAPPLEPLGEQLKGPFQEGPSLPGGLLMGRATGATLLLTAVVLMTGWWRRTRRGRAVF